MLNWFTISENGAMFAMNRNVVQSLYIIRWYGIRYCCIGSSMVFLNQQKGETKKIWRRNGQDCFSFFRPKTRSSENRQNFLTSLEYMQRSRQKWFCVCSLAHTILALAFLSSTNALAEWKSSIKANKWCTKYTFV